MSKKLGVWGSLLLLLTLIGMTGVGSASAATTSAAHGPDETHWTPVGVTWNLTVQFLSGSRQGQTESSIMTFLPNGRLTATFPNSTLLPAIDGRWYFTSTNAFHYSFRDQLTSEGIYVLVQLNAYLTSKTTYEAGGVGVAYSIATNQPVGYNVTQTSAFSS